MKKIVLSIMIVLVTLPIFAQQQAQAKQVLDRTALAIEKAGGVKVNFKVQVFSKGRAIGVTTGEICLKKEKFFLKTPDHLSWFDGQTQWSYLIATDEVNISTPTQTELQSLNPYALLSVYKKGFTYKLGAMKNFHGKAMIEVELMSVDKKSDFERMVLYVTKDTYQPLYILVEQRGGDRSEITVSGYQTGMKWPNSFFEFDKRKYPNAEVIDLR